MITAETSHTMYSYGIEIVVVCEQGLSLQATNIEATKLKIKHFYQIAKKKIQINLLKNENSSIFVNEM